MDRSFRAKYGKQQGWKETTTTSPTERVDIKPVTVVDSTRLGTPITNQNIRTEMWTDGQVKLYDVDVMRKRLGSFSMDNCYIAWAKAIQSK